MGNEIVINKEYAELTEKYKSLLEQLTTLIEEHDFIINYEVTSIETEYTIKVGELEYEEYKIYIECLKLKKKIQMVQRLINLQKDINEKKIDKEIEKEYKEYMDMLKKMQHNLQVARHINDCDALTLDQRKELKRLYRKLAKKLHPDVNPNITEKQKDLWNRVKKAYENTDLELLKTLVEITEDITEGNSEYIGENLLTELEEKCNKVKQKIIKYIQKIEDIKKKFPFTEVDFLKDNDAIKKRQQELRNSIKEYKKVRLDLKAYLDTLLPAKPKNRSYIN